MSKNNFTEEAKRVIDARMDWFEDHVMFLTLNNPKFYRNFLKSFVNVDVPGLHIQDFSKPIDNHIYEVCRDYYDSFERLEDIEHKSVPLNFILSSTAVKISKAVLTDESLQIVVRRINELNEKCSSENLSFIENGVNYWLEKRRTTQVMAYTMHHPNANAEMLQNTLKRSISNIQASQLEVDTVWEIFEEEEEADDTERIPTNISMFDQVLGGLVKQEFGLVIAPPSGGKTVCACQLGAALALGGSKVAFITTEQRPKELMPRIVSNFCEIPFNLIKDGVNRQRILSLGQSQQDKVTNLMKAISTNLSFVDWSKRGHTFVNSFESMFEMFDDRGFVPDVLICDWLGGGLPEGTKREDVRNILFDASNAMINTCKRRDTSLVVMTQADATLSKNVAKIDFSHLADNKMLHRDYTWAVGISCIMEEEGKGSGVGRGQTAKLKNSPSNNYASEQYFNFFKTRKDNALCIPVLRDFGYQRFKPKYSDNNVLKKPLISR